MRLSFTLAIEPLQVIINPPLETEMIREIGFLKRCMVTRPDGPSSTFTNTDAVVRKTGINMDKGSDS